MFKAVLISSFVSSLILISTSAHAVCEKMSEEKASAVVALINAQIKQSPNQLGTIETSVSYRNIKLAKVIKTQTGYSQVALVTTNSSLEVPYTILDVGAAYLKLEMADKAVHLGYLTDCNVKEAHKIGYRPIMDLSAL